MTLTAFSAAQASGSEPTSPRNLHLPAVHFGSVIHEFSGDVKSKVTLIQDGHFGPTILDGLVFNTSTERLGTHGQIGFGSAIVVGDTGWLGYGRADLKVGENIQGAWASTWDCAIGGSICLEGQ